MSELEQDISRLNGIINALTIDLDNALHMTIPQRIICKMVKLSNGEAAYRLPVSKGTLALRIGIEPETLSRAAPRLENHGVIVTGRNVAFVDKQIMTKTVCDTCAGRKSCMAVKELMGE